MPQSDPTDARDTPSSSVSSEKRRKSKIEGSKKRAYNDMRLANGRGSHVLRRSSISKPGRDRRDEPTIKRQKREKRRQTDGERDAASADDDSKAGSGARSLTRLDSPVIDFDGLSRPSVGTRERLEESPEEAAARLDRIKGAVRTLLECIGENPNREGLLATPDRYAKAMMFFTRGYEQNVLDIVNGAIFQEGHSEMVIVKDVDIYSVCEHHLVPFTGKMHIGYIPNNAVIGISKLPRIAEMFARRLQIQERLTKEVANAIFEVLRPQGVAVVMESSHLCMVMRGVQKTSSTTVTSCMLGCFERREKTRNEFLSLINVNRH
ncbi:GTP cyclohydrolase 1 [Tolypocladium ophioglossoides CBS 100239]|uniref:GTP cyclohydrolase 1 n=1 Tax=Tolypocladium ophioglossoides (strain CBS 100239) TaxID=1163406 RepID=A0A0L0N5G7_TOLOC|nr:GTP cyclohydrolase 1 [Tolypocladium ophioglossoides CBS 100239]